jgi:hypothetical protein
MTMTFYVYENWTHTFAKVHRGPCVFCKEGNGLHGAGRATPNGEWHGPYVTKQSASADADAVAARHANREKWDVDACRVCCA